VFEILGLQGFGFYGDLSCFKECGSEKGRGYNIGSRQDTTIMAKMKIYVDYKYSYKVYRLLLS
jgi:hypothetical protein